MAGTKAKRSKPASDAVVKTDDAVENQELQADDGLILVTKDGEESRIHPSTLASHQAAGWRQ
jgi:hypothetical protein